MRDKFHPEILTGSLFAGASNKGGVGKTSYFLAYESISRKRCEIRPKLLLMTNRKLHMRFRLAPSLMTLDDFEVL